MKHAEILNVHSENEPGKQVAFQMDDGRTVTLVEREYSQEELDIFNAASREWMLCREGSKFFLSDSENGEDAAGDYCAYFDLRPDRAVFDDGVFVGVYLSCGNIGYYGNGRSSFEISDYGYPGDNVFGYISRSSVQYLFLFDEPETHSLGDWTLLKRKPDESYDDYLIF